MRDTSRFEYRVFKTLSTGMTIRNEKRDLAHAEKDLAQFIEERDAGKLSPHFDNCEAWVEKRWVSKWVLVDEEIE